MSQKTIILTVILFALIVFGMFTFARLRSIELDEQSFFNLGRLLKTALV